MPNSPRHDKLIRRQPMETKLLTKKQAAEQFQVSERTLDRWRAAGFVKAFKVGSTVRVLVEELAGAWRRRRSLDGGRAGQRGDGHPLPGPLRLDGPPGQPQGR